MATVAVGDIHGHRAALDDLLAKVVPTLRPDDHLVFLGDYIDRGPDSKGVLDRLVELKARPPCRLSFLLGNHEEWLLDTHRDPTRHSWLAGMEGLTTIRSYDLAAAERLREAMWREGLRLVTERVPLPYEAFFAAMPAAHLDLLAGLARFVRTPDVVCVHGGLDPDGGPAEEQAPRALTWGDEAFPARYEGDDLVVYGHAADPVVGPDGWPRPRVTHGRAWGIDTIQHGVLTAVRFPGGEVIQSARHG